MQKPQVWPVIHYTSDAIALDNAAMAAEVGATGVFVISMEGNDAPLVPVATLIKKRHPLLKVGVNHLGLPPSGSLAHNLHARLDATWTDSPGVSSAFISPAAQAVSQRLRWVPHHLFFASVAFKYQAPEPAPGRAAVMAATLGMIPTSSGTATGVAADLSKLNAMHEDLLEFSNTPAARESNWPRRAPTDLGLASGVTPENVVDVIGLVSHILVATGISADEHHFDYEKLALLMGRIAAAPKLPRREGGQREAATTGEHPA